LARKLKTIELSIESLLDLFTTDNVSNRVRNEFNAQGKILYRNLSQEEETNLILEIQAKILDPSTPRAGTSFKNNWESNWKSNLLDFQEQKNKSSLIPKFISENQVARFKGKFVMPLTSNFEMQIVKILRVYLFEKYFSEINELHEFGAGTGFNLVHFGEIFREKKLYGYDWSESAVDLINRVADQNNLMLKAELFDMFNPNYEVKIPENSGLLTVGAMEQLGTNWKPFLDFMLAKDFNIYINIETIYEKTNQGDTEFARISRQYIERRNWLRGYFDELRKLELDGLVEILDQKVVVGSKFHDSWSFTVWRLANV